MNNIVTLLMGTNEKNRNLLLKKKFNNLSWWSDNLETVAHYYEGCVIEIVVKLDSTKQKSYVRCIEDLAEMLEHYTYGFAEINYPKGATWYSFSANYLKDNIISIKEVFPNLSEFNEDDEVLI